MIGTCLSRDAVLGQPPAECLQALLQRRFVIAQECRRASFVDRVLELAAQECVGRLEASVEIERRNQRFVAVGEQRLLETAARLLLATPQDEVLAETKALGMPRQ